MKKNKTQKEDAPYSLVFGATIFISAFLLFLIQPMFSKFILPWYGGSPTVWTTCMLFYQTLLLFGYAYAHVLTKYVPLKGQVIIHCLLLLVSLLQLPPIPGEALREQAASAPVMSILTMLVTTIGLPYGILSATSPLIQRWFASAYPKSSPYRLYALSNVGSLLALLSFPFLIEPNLTRQLQAGVWAWGMGVFILTCGAVAYMLWSGKLAAPEKIAHEPVQKEAVPLLSRALWIVLPAAASIFLLATTNKMCQDIVVVPLLWILPLALYLVSFIISFDKPQWYSRPVFVTLFILSLAGVVYLLMDETQLTILPVLATFPVLMFAVSMICHGETARLKPSPQHLTSYYLHIAFGGAIGSIVVVLVAPLIFIDYSEYHVGIFLTVLALLVIYYTDKRSKLYHGKKRWAWAIIIVLVLACAVTFQIGRNMYQRNMLTQKRSFYGTIRVNEYNKWGERLKYRVMNHGTILHGMQFIDPQFKKIPTTYYSPESGLGYCIQNFPRIDSVRFGAVGLGVGTIATWTGKNDYLRIYEINPDVLSLANEYFTYLEEAEGKVDVVMGDARLSLEREEPQQFDILVLDAFNSDTPPIHLLTEEAFALYIKHIKEDGVIAVHVSCKYLDFFPVVSAMAQRFGMGHRLIDDENPNEDIHRKESSWVLISSNAEFLNNPEIMKVGIENGNIDTTLIWRDDYSSLFPIILW